MKRTLLAISVLVSLVALNGAEPKSEARLNDAATVINEIMQAGDQSIPQDLLDKAECVVVIPGMKKGGFIVSAKYGRGFLTCRAKTARGWSAPAPMRAEGGGVGFQIGAEESDLILLVFNKAGAGKLLGSKFTVGADGSVAAGPVGRSASAQTDARMRAEMLSWSRSRGVFAGVSLDGATLRQDEDWTRELYGNKDLAARQIVFGNTKVPSSAATFLASLKKHSPVQKN